MVRRAPAEVAVRCVDVSIARAGLSERVVEGVSVTVPHGGALGIMGPTGSGKSSLLTVLAGADAAELAVVGGDADVEGIRVRRPGRARRELTFHVGHLPQSAGAHLPSRMTVSEVISEPITSRDRRVNQRALQVRVASLLDELELPLGCAHSYPYELSAGMRQRVAFARALVLEPRVFMGDEPYANLDVEVRRAARDALLRRRDERDMSIVITTNDSSALSDLDAAALVLRGGRPVAYGASVDELLWTPDGGARAVS